MKIINKLRGHLEPDPSVLECRRLIVQKLNSLMVESGIRASSDFFYLDPAEERIRFQTHSSSLYTKFLALIVLIIDDDALSVWFYDTTSSNRRFHIDAGAEKRVYDKIKTIGSLKNIKVTIEN